MACVHGAYDYQGQKCAAASRLYVPHSLWPALRQRLIDLTRQVVVGDPTQPGTHIGAVMNASQFRKHDDALARARAEELVVVGGNTDDSTGWFVDPTVLEVSDPYSPFMTEELFAPVIAAYVYDDIHWADTLQLVDESTVYGLTGAVFAADEGALTEAGNHCDIRPATFTSTTNRPVPWWGNNLSAGRGRLARMTRWGPSGT